MALKYFETATAYSAANPKNSDVCFVEEEGAIYTHDEKFGGKLPEFGDIVTHNASEFQTKLTSGSTIKTINSTSLLGAGNISVVTSTDDCVKTTTQILTTAQKSQARANIDTLTVDYGSSVTPVTTSSENTQNKVTSISESSTNTEYPSAKAVYDAIQDSYNTNVQRGTSVQLGDISNYTLLKLDSSQISRLNAATTASFHFVIRDGFEAAALNTEWRYMGVYMGPTSIRCYYNGRISINDVDYGSSSSWLNKYNSYTIYPDIFTITIDRINGIVKFYDKTTLINTLQNDSYKTSSFVNSSGIIKIHSGDYNVRFYDISVYDDDISKLFDLNADVKAFEQNVDGAYLQPPIFDQNFKLYNGSFVTFTNSYGSETGWTVSNNGATRTYSNSSNTNTLYCGYYTAKIASEDSNKPLQRARQFEVDLQVTSGVVNIVSRNATLILIDSGGNETVSSISGGISTLSNVGTGTYTLRGWMCKGEWGWGLARVSGSVVVKETQRRFKPIACCVHVKGDTLYDGRLYDDQADVFYKKSSEYTSSEVSGITGVSINLNQVINPGLLSIPLKTIKTSITPLPHYQGELAVVSTNAHIGVSGYTWKKINNS